MNVENVTIYMTSEGKNYLVDTGTVSINALVAMIAAACGGGIKLVELPPALDLVPVTDILEGK